MLDAQDISVDCRCPGWGRGCRDTSLFFAYGTEAAPGPPGLLICIMHFISGFASPNSVYDIIYLHWVHVSIKFNISSYLHLAS
jgi:hypothetical protein